MTARTMASRMMVLLMAQCAWFSAYGISVLQAEPTVFFRGKELSFRHYVYGEVIAATPMYGSINLGYAHGIQIEQRIGVLRRSEGNLIPIGVLRITRLRAGDALGEYEGAMEPHREDIAIIAARDLNLWHSRSRADQLVNQSLLDRSPAGYDTGDLSLSLLKEVGADDELVNRRPKPLHVNLNEYASRRLKPTVSVIRGAFRPGNGLLDGAANSLSARDRELAPDQPTLDLESALARYVTTSPTGKLILSPASLRALAETRPGVQDLDIIQEDVDRENRRVHQSLKP